MIYLQNGENTIVLTGSEIKKVSTFFLEVTHQQSFQSITIPIINLSNSDRFDLFEIQVSETGSTSGMTGTTGSIQNMQPGYYDYKLYGPTVSDSNVLEIGKMLFKGSTVSPPVNIYKKDNNNYVYNG